MLVSYQLLYSFVGIAVQHNLHSEPLVIEKMLFGNVASLVLQQAISSPILDFAGAFFYTAYFFAPALFTFILWRRDRANYWKYTIAFGLCSYSALITYLFYPVAPPWIAVPNVSQVLVTNVDPVLGVPVYHWAFDVVNPDLYGAFPSMHSGLPWLVFLFAFRTWRWKSLPIAAFPIGAWFSALYLGEHYFIDVVGGIAYATIAYYAATTVLPSLFARISYLSKYLPKKDVKP
jgi:membrane-associated phospholipid phosphatase